MCYKIEHISTDNTCKMSFIHDVLDDYRHFRTDHPELRWLFLIGDLLNALVKLAVFAGFFYVCWYVISRNPPQDAVTAEATRSEPRAEAPELSSGRIAVLEEIASQDRSTGSGLVGSVETSPAELAEPSAVGQVISLQSAEPVVQVESQPDTTANYVEVDEIPTVFSTPTETVDKYFNPLAPIENVNWVLDQSSERYTVQLAMTVNTSFLVQFTSRTPEEHVAAIYPERRIGDDKIQYSLALGSFPDLKSAEDALSSLPDSLKRYGAHSRKFDDIQRTISPFVQ